MRLVVVASLLFSCSIVANQDVPSGDIEVVVLDIPPAGRVTSTAGTDVIVIRGLPEASAPVELPRGWEAESAPGGGVMLLQGPPVGNTITIKFTSPDPNWQADVAGFNGMEPLWNAAPLNRDSIGISVKTMQASDVFDTPEAKCSRAQRKVSRNKSSGVNDRNMKGAPASTSDVLGTWISEPSLGQLGVIQSSYTFRENGTFSLKTDFISFCDGCNRGIDCDYFWIIQEGSYSGNRGAFKLNIENEKRVLSLAGQADPETTENSNYPTGHDMLIELKDDILLIRKSDGGETSVLHRQN